MLSQATYSTWTLFYYIIKSDIIESLREQRKKEVNIINKIQKEAEFDKKINDDDTARNTSIFRYFNNMVLPQMIRICYKYNLKKEKVMPLGITKSWVINFFKNMPTHYTFWSLSFRRNIETKGKIDKNDANDIAALSIAVPYCDIVFADKKWIPVAYKEKINEIYNTEIFTSVHKLYEYI